MRIALQPRLGLLQIGGVKALGDPYHQTGVSHFVCPAEPLIAHAAVDYLGAPEELWQDGQEGPGHLADVPQLLGLAQELVTEIRMGDLNQAQGALGRRFPTQIAHPVLCHDELRVHAGIGYRPFEFGHDA